jgi:polysaccharide biosynthesis/export protein
VKQAMQNALTRAAILSVIRSRSGAQNELDNGTTVFGVDVFRRETSLFNANDAGPVPADYRLGPGDELALVLTGDTEQTYQLPVSREGAIFVPNVGEIQVANLSMKQLEDVLYSRLARFYSGVRRGAGATTHFQVTVTNLGTNQVSVLGDVNAPGAYRISKLGNTLTALYAAGGPTDNGSLRQVRVIRNGSPVATIDLYDYLISGNTATTVRLESGDVVLVPPRGPQVRLTGPVLRPATYELLPTEALSDLIRMAGGFRPEADRRRVQIERVVPPNRRTAAGMDRELFDVTSAAIESSREPLAAGDVVRVLAINGRVANRTSVAGSVWTPGPIALTTGMRLSQAIAQAGGFKPDTYEGFLQVTRLEPDQTQKIVRVRLPGRPSREPMDPAILTEDLELRADDQIRVFSQSEYRPATYVTIGGSVKNPGQYPYVEGMTLRTLVMQAGGLSEGALLTEAELSRMPADRSKGTTAHVTRVPLDSTYLFDRKPGDTHPRPPGVAAPANSAPDVVLQPYDAVAILQQPGWMLPRTVRILGEVKYPAEYTLISKDERLADLIDRAGGFTPEAYPEGIQFTRDTIGRIGVDLPRAMRDRSSAENIPLINGDVITIPFRVTVVRIQGAVNSPATVPYVNGADLNYYISVAGGTAQNGDARRTFVTQPSGKIEARRRRLFVTRTSPTPQPGSVVTVPVKIPEPKFDPSAILTAIASMATSAIAIVAILKK